VLWITWEIAHSQKGAAAIFLRSLRGVVVSTLIAAPLVFPLLEYSRLSTRADLAAEDVLAFSLPPARLLGLIFPDFGGPHEWMLYLGGVVLLLVLLAILWPRSRKRSSYWVWVFGLSIIYSFGEHIPILPVMARLPGFSMLRVPSRALFLTGFAGVILGASALNHLLAGIRQSEARRARLAVLSVPLFAAAIGFAMWIATGQAPLNIVWGVGIFATTAIWIFSYLNNRLPKKIWLLGIWVITILDLGVMDQSLFSLRPASMVLAEGKAVAEYLDIKPGRFRVYSPSYSLPQQTAAYYGLELADGVDPLQLEAYAQFMENATGIPRQGYSITQPPFGEGDVDLALSNEHYLPNAELAYLNVRYVVAEFDLDIEYVDLSRFGNTRVYEIQNSLGYAYLQDSDEGSVQTISWSPNRIDIQVTGPGTLIISEIPYPGWQAVIDGEKVEVDTMDGVNRSVEIPEGRNLVSFIFRPLSLYLGIGFSSFTIVGMIIVSRRHEEVPGIE
jgi:hypothetical protein